jgi:hypothetical protein
MPSKKTRTLAEIIGRRFAVEAELRTLAETMSNCTVAAYVEARKRLQDERKALGEEEMRLAGMD